jgi:hypothetical protein
VVSFCRKAGEKYFYKEQSMKKTHFLSGIALLAAVIIGLAGCEQPVYNAGAESGQDTSLGVSRSVGAVNPDDPSVKVGTATVGDITVSGASHFLVSSDPVVIELGGNYFINIAADDAVTSWFTNLPAGLTAAATYDVYRGDTEITITISGIPTEGASRVMDITIPADMLVDDSSDIVVAANPSANYDITATIIDEGDLELFANAIANGETTQNAKLESSSTCIDVAGAPFVPISTNIKAPYTGVFDGNFGKIHIEVRGESSYLALFGINNGIIKNLTVTGNVEAASPSGDSVDYVAGVVAYNDIGGTIQRVISQVVVNADDDNIHNIGGIVGFNGWDQYNPESPHSGQTYQTGGLIYQCRNEGAVTGGFNKIGGIAGENAWQIVECVNTGVVTCNKLTSGWPGVGGIVGRNGNNNVATEQGHILNSYNTAEVVDGTGASSSHNAFGGITGWCDDLANVISCFTIGLFPQPTGQKNPIIGMADHPSGTMSTNNYALKDIYVNSNDPALTGTRLSEQDMQMQSFVDDLNNTAYGSPYVFIPNHEYPKLKWELDQTR